MLTRLECAVIVGGFVTFGLLSFATHVEKLISDSARQVAVMFPFVMKLKSVDRVPLMAAFRAEFDRT